MFISRHFLEKPLGSRSLQQATSALGAAASLLCGIHCLALPVFTALMLFVGVSWRMQSSLELAFMAGSFLLAIIVFLPAAIGGRNPFALQAATLAILFFLSGWQFASLSGLLRETLTVSASMLLLVAHVQNLWQLRRTAMSASCALQHCHPSA